MRSCETTFYIKSRNNDGDINDDDDNNDTGFWNLVTANTRMRKFGYTNRVHFFINCFIANSH